MVTRYLPSLLSQIDGRTVTVGGVPTTLHAKGIPVRLIRPDWRDRFLGVVGNPEMAYILMLLGIAGIVFEIAHPGFVLPGTVGLLSLAVARKMLPLWNSIGEEGTVRSMVEYLLFQVNGKSAERRSVLDLLNRDLKKESVMPNVLEMWKQEGRQEGRQDGCREASKNFCARASFRLPESPRSSRWIPRGFPRYRPPSPGRVEERKNRPARFGTDSKDKGQSIPIEG